MRKLIVFLSLILMGTSAGAWPRFFNHRHRQWPTTVTQNLPSGITYDTSIGNGVDASGRANLTPRTGATVYYVNSTTGNDANTCLQAQSPSTPRATIKQGEACVTDGNGDFLLIAQGMSYPNGFAYVGDKGGYSPQYPVVYESYDPADPTNQAKWGTATGTNRPDINMGSGADNSGGFIQGSGTSKQYRAFRGLKFDGQSVADAGPNILPNTTGTPDYILFENDEFASAGISVQGGEGTPLHHAIFRSSSFHGEWDSSGRGQGIYFNWVDGATVEDSAFPHTGWKDGANSTDSYTIGGPSPQAHPIYEQDGTVNLMVRRNVFIDDSGDGSELKSGGLYINNLSIANPIGVGLGGGNLYSEHDPLGSYGDSSFNAFLSARWCIETINFKQGSGSSANYNVCANSDPTTGTPYGLMADDPPDLSGATGISLPSYPTFDHNILYSWGASGHDQAIHINSGTALIGDIHSTYTNNLWDDPTSGSNTSNSGATFPNAYTETSILAALGEASQSAAESDWEANPQNHGWESGVGLVLSGYGLVDPGLVNLTTNMALTAGYAITGQFIHTRDGSTYTTSGLPSGVAFDSGCKCWRYDGSNTTVSSGNFTITENNGALSHTTTIPWSISARPVLSGLSVTAGSGQVTINISTNTGSGTEFAEALTTATAPDWAHIRGAMDASDNQNNPHASQSITTSGAQPGLVITGLTNGTTYYAQVAQVAQLDGNSNPSLTSTSVSFVPNATWTPASLGSNLALDLTELDSSHLFTDTGCTTALTTDGQTAKCIKDSTTGIKFTNSTGWVYHANSGKPYLAMDGSSFFTSTTAVTFADATGQYAIWGTANFTGTPAGNGYLVWVSGGNALLNPNPINNANNFNVRSSSAQLANAWSKPVAANTDYVFSGISTGTSGTSGNAEAFVNNVDTPGSGVVAWSGTPLTSATLLISQSGGTSAGKFYGLLIAKGDQTANRSAAQTYMAALHP